jgi:hypothetical protein
MTSSKLVITAFAVASASCLTPSLHAQAAGAKTPAAPQADHEAHHPGAETAQPPKPAGTQAGMQGQMMARMKEQEAKLDALVAKMNGAKGDAKVNAIAELLTAMAQQHKSMRAEMMPMHEEMMKKMGGGK